MGYGYGQSCLHPLVANDLHFELHRNRIIDAPVRPDWQDWRNIPITLILFHRMNVTGILQQPSFRDAANSLAFIDLPASRNFLRPCSSSDLSAYNPGV